MLLALNNCAHIVKCFIKVVHIFTAQNIILSAILLPIYFYILLTNVVNFEQQGLDILLRLYDKHADLVIKIKLTLPFIIVTKYSTAVSQGIRNVIIFYVFSDHNSIKCILIPKVVV